MKKLSFLILFLCALSLSAQSGFGIKGGLTYNADDGLFKTLESTYEKKGEGSMGYHIGVYKRVELTGLYIQPELTFVSFKNEFEDASSREFDVKYKKIDLPVSVGTSVLGMGYVQAGPVFSYYFEDDIDRDQISDIKQDDISLAFQIGGGVQLDKFSVSARYDFPLGERETEWVQNNYNFKTESSPKLLHISLGYRF